MTSEREKLHIHHVGRRDGEVGTSPSAGRTAHDCLCTRSMRPAVSELGDTYIASTLIGDYMLRDTFAPIRPLNMEATTIDRQGSSSARAPATPIASPSDAALAEGRVAAQRGFRGTRHAA